ncbi:MAG: imidazole glycerol phosphate synthase subunit HisH [Actinomycetota bacterium]
MSPAPRIAVVDYGIGNLRSAQKALEKCGATATLTSDPATISAADAVVLPGVGAFGACMESLRAAGLEDPVRGAATGGAPFLGICVGMQMLFTASAESPGVPGLGIIAGNVEWLPGSLPRPQMQWNRLRPAADDPMFTGLGTEPWMYCVHSLHSIPADPAVVAATVDYGATVNAAFRSGPIFAVQFHPEKSGASGLALLANFVSLAARS